MISRNYNHCFSLIAGLLVMGCRQSYQPAVVTTNLNYLVVDGFLNSGTDSSFITLSRTRSLTAPSTAVRETGAQVSIEGNNGYKNSLAPLGNGVYTAYHLNLPLTQQYRINIVTANGSKYVSDYTPVKPSPQIDSISWQRGDSGVVVFANTHDSSNQTRFYRWEFNETWEYHSVYSTYLRYDFSDSTLYSDSVQVPNICWDTSHSTDILIATSAKLSRDVINGAPLTLVAANAEKLSFRYSILVKQYALSEDAYNYWGELKKSTELTGGLFDQQPSRVTGNVHCVTNPAEPVFGFISVGTIAKKRIFIDNSQVLPWHYDIQCGEVTLHSIDSLIYYENTGGWLAIKTVPPEPTNNPSAYIVSSNFCVDCTARRGTAVKPSYW